MKKTAASGAKTPLFDRIFKPEVITLENGHTVTRPRSRTPLIALLVIAALAISVKVTGFNLAIIVKRANQLTKILSQIFQPDPSFFSKVVTPLLDTIKMSIMGSVIGCLLALPYAVAASANINRNKVSLSVLRFILNIVRTLPTLVIASICALVFGLGTFAGTVAIVIFTFGVVTKMLYESIETINMGPFEALESAGADKFRAFWSAVFPQVLPTYLSHCLYSFEMNVRAASILAPVRVARRAARRFRRAHRLARLQRSGHGAADAVRRRAHHRKPEPVPAQQAQLREGYHAVFKQHP